VASAGEGRGTTVLDPPAATDHDVPARARKAAGIGATTTWLGGLLLLVSVALRGLSVERWPLGNMFEFAVMAAMFTSLAYSVWSTRRDLRWLGLFITLPLLLLLGAAVTVWYTEAAELLPSLQSYWLVIHVTVAVLATAVFTIGAAATGIYLVKDAFERSGRRSVLDRFPATSSIERTAYGLHIVAFPLWTFTLIAGAIWARQAWASYWNWDPKEVWTFVIWVVYAAYLHSRATSGVSRQTASYIALAGYACIIVNFTVVNVFFVGQHSYSGL
jgi:cytochrome c-type biogenesis protein CcsB